MSHKAFLLDFILFLCYPVVRSCGKAIGEFNYTLLYTINVFSYDEGQFPWNAIIECDQIKLCNGVLISDQFVITSSLCAFDDPDLYKIFLGVYDLDDLREFEGFEVLDIVISDEVDLALFQLKNRVKFNDFIQPICLYEHEVIPESFGYVAGYQEIEIGFRNIPIFMNLSITSFEKCADEYFDTNSSFKYCATLLYYTQCAGEVGTGFYMMHNETFYLRGVLSYWKRNTPWRYICHYTLDILIFNNMTRQIGWVTKVLRENSTNRKFKEVQKVEAKKSTENIIGMFLQINECIHVNETIISGWGCNRAELQFNGSLILSTNRRPFKSYWSSQTDGRGAVKACMMEGGTFEIINDKNETIWSTLNSSNGRKAVFALQDDGQMSIHTKEDYKIVYTSPANVNYPRC